MLFPIDHGNSDPRAILWVATKFTGDPEVSAAAKLICEQSVEQNA